MTSPLSFPRRKIRVVLLEGIHESAADLFREAGYTTISRSPSDLRDARLLGIRSGTHLDQKTLEQAQKLLAVGCFCIGTSQVDLEHAAGRGVPVFNAPHSNTRSVAELVIGLTIVLMRDIVRKSGQVHAGSWPKTALGSREVRGKTIGIIGYGHIGSQVSIMAEALGMRVVFYDILDKLPLGNAVKASSMASVLREAEVVTLHVPHTPDTVDLIGPDELRAMCGGAVLINTSRGVVVDQEALAAALVEERLAGAAVDVYPREPDAPDAAVRTPLRGLPNVILTPHIGGATQEAQLKIGTEVAAKLIGFSDRGSTVSAVNFPELSLPPHAGAHRILHIHRNVPGMLGQINRAVADEEINVQAQRLETRGPIGYVVLDIEKGGSTRLFAKLKAIDGTVRARILY